MLVPSDRPQLHPAFVHQPIRKIILAIAELSLLTELQIKGPSRQRAISQARHAGMWCARQLTDASLPDIGRAFGMFDHTSVLYAVRGTPGALRGRSRPRSAEGRVDGSID